MRKAFRQISLEKTVEYLAAVIFMEIVTHAARLEETVAEILSRVAFIAGYPCLKLKRLFWDPGEGKYGMFSSNYFFSCRFFCASPERFRYATAEPPPPAPPFPLFHPTGNSLPPLPSREWRCRRAPTGGARGEAGRGPGGE